MSEPRIAVNKAISKAFLPVETIYLKDILHEALSFMRIGFFTDSYFPEIDGVTYTLKSWKERLEEKGHEIYIIYPKNSGYEPGENEIPVASVRNPFYAGYRIPIPTGFSDIPELDIVHCHGPGPIGRLGSFYASRKQVPKIYTHHTPIEDYFEQTVKSKKISDILTRLYLPVENRFLKGFDTVTASSKIHRDVEYQELPVGVDTEFFKPSEGEMFEDKKGPVIGYSGRLSNEKNVGKILDFMDGFDGTLVIVGEGPKEESLKEKAGDAVVFKKFLPRDKLPEFYSSIDCYITASTGDTLGLAPLEANACGTPVLAPDVHPFDQTIGPMNGERYSFSDESDFDSKLEVCLGSDYDTRKAVENMSLSQTVEKLEGIYVNLDDR